MDNKKYAYYKLGSNTDQLPDFSQKYRQEDTLRGTYLVPPKILWSTVRKNPQQRMQVLRYVHGYPIRAVAGSPQYTLEILIDMEAIHGENYLQNYMIKEHALVDYAHIEFLKPEPGTSQEQRQEYFADLNSAVQMSNTKEMTFIMGKRRFAYEGPVKEILRFRKNLPTKRKSAPITFFDKEKTAKKRQNEIQDISISSVAESPVERKFFEQYLSSSSISSWYETKDEGIGITDVIEFIADVFDMKD